MEKNAEYWRKEMLKPASNGCKTQKELDYFNKLVKKHGVYTAWEWAKKNMKPSKYQRFNVFMQINWC
jgi:hypothetical protein